MSNYFKINKYDTANGEGLRTTIFFTFCEFYCESCFNKDIWDFNVGKTFTREVYENKIKPTISDYTAGISVIGGEPLHPRNIEAVSDLIDWFKQDFPNKNIWVWTGYTWEELVERCKKGNEDDLNWLLCSIDVLVDGRFEIDKKDLTLKWRGSSNQRVIDVQETLKNDKIVLYCK